MIYLIILCEQVCVSRARVCILSIVLLLSLLLKTKSVVSLTKHKL